MKVNQMLRIALRISILLFVTMLLLPSSPLWFSVSRTNSLIVHVCIGTSGGMALDRKTEKKANNSKSMKSIEKPLLSVMNSNWMIVRCLHNFSAYEVICL